MHSDAFLLNLEKERREEKLKYFRWPSSRFLKGENWGETKIIRCREMALYQSSKIRVRRRRAEKISKKNHTALMWEQTQLSSTDPLILLIHPFYVINGKEKRQILFSYVSIVVFLWYTIYVQIWTHTHTHTHTHTYIYIHTHTHPHTHTHIYIHILHQRKSWGKKPQIYFKLGCLYPCLFGM